MSLIACTEGTLLFLLVCAPFIRRCIQYNWATEIVPNLCLSTLWCLQVLRYYWYMNLRHWNIPDNGKWNVFCSRMIDCMIDWFAFMHWSNDWSIDRLSHWLIDRSWFHMVSWLIYLFLFDLITGLVDWFDLIWFDLMALIDSLVHWFNQRLIDLFSCINWLIGRLIVYVIHWFIGIDFSWWADRVQK